MEWVILLANLGMAGLLARIWITHLERVQELKGRQEHALRVTEEHLQEIDQTQAAIAAVEGELPEIEDQAQMLNAEIKAASEYLDRLKSTEGGLHPSRHQV
ncbi:MAG: hypothetical protein IT369_19190 [Candidatus Latescibacteria bacterium]|nr:hypothetical protein [Candidatus Latescibacterota bacterium]